jgi:putative peptide zinc metalloprotease protein
MRKLVLILGTVLMSALPAGVPILAHADDNSAAALNTTDGKTVWRISFQVSRSMSSVVDNTNIAFAYSSCTGCSTYAIAFQTVLGMNDPTVVTPTNLAVAINYQCVNCTTYADATQVVLTTGTNLHFTAQGNQDLASIRQQLEALRHANLTLDQLAAQVNLLSQQLVWIVANELVPAGNA